jgi:predicted Zn-dependent peptidase
MTVRELFARVDAVTAADARRVIKQHSRLENLLFTLIGKSSEIASLAKKYATDIQTKSITAAGF